MMAPKTDIQSAETNSAPNDFREESTSLPWFRTWRGVYLFVFVCFVFYVILLTLFSRAFS